METIRFENRDCLELLKELPTGSVDLMLQDPPYGVTQNEWDKEPFLPLMWAEWERVLKPDGAWIFFSTNPFAASLITSRAGFFRYDIVWKKSHPTGFLNAKRMPLRSHELILVFYRSLPTYNPILKKKPKKDIRPDTGNSKHSSNYGSYSLAPSRDVAEDLSYPKSIWECSIDQNQVHPTQKPLKLIRELVHTYSNEGDTVFDGYSGSGTTAIACIKEKRKFIGAELNAEYYSIAADRIKEESSKLVLF